MRYGRGGVRLAPCLMSRDLSVTRQRFVCLLMPGALLMTLRAGTARGVEINRCGTRTAA